MIFDAVWFWGFQSACAFCVGFILICFDLSAAKRKAGNDHRSPRRPCLFPAVIRSYGVVSPRPRSIGHRGMGGSRTVYPAHRERRMCGAGVYRLPGILVYVIPGILLVAALLVIAALFVLGFDWRRR